MQNRRISADLHVHRNCPGNDSSRSPKEICQLAIRKGIRAISILSHDTVAGISESREIAESHDLIYIPGIEISVIDQGYNLHIHGYGIQEDNGQLIGELSWIAKARQKRMRTACENLWRIHGIRISFEDVVARTVGSSKGIHLDTLILTKATLKVLLIERGYVPNPKDDLQGFRKEYDRILDDETLLPKQTISFKKAAQIIHQAGGIVVASHLAGGKSPTRTPSFQDIQQWKKEGLDGIEIYHPDHDENGIRTLLDIAQELDLVITGGSDDHGDMKPEGAEVGSFGLTQEEFRLFFQYLN